MHIAKEPRTIWAKALSDNDESLLLSLILQTQPSSSSSHHQADPPLLLPPLSLTIGTSPCLEITLPPFYPENHESALPLLRWKDGANRCNIEKREALLRLTDISESHLGCEHLLPLIQEFQSMEEERGNLQAGAQQSGDNADASGSRKTSSLPREMLGRRLIFFHHIINPTKRECVMKWAIEYGLGGYSKIGWPGVVVVEGRETQVQEYVRALSRLRWQQITVRGEEQIVCPEGKSIDDLRKLHRGFEEFGEHDMSKLAAAMRDAGLEDLFKTLMK